MHIQQHSMPKIQERKVLELKNSPTKWDSISLEFLNCKRLTAFIIQWNEDNHTWKGGPGGFPSPAGGGGGGPEGYLMNFKILI